MYYFDFKQSLKKLQTKLFACKIMYIIIVVIVYA